MPHSPSNEYLTDIYQLKDIFIRDIFLDENLSFFINSKILSKIEWIEFYCLVLIKMASYIKMDSALWSDFSWIFGEVVDGRTDFLIDGRNIEYVFFNLYMKRKDDILFEVYHGDVRSFIGKNLDYYLNQLL